jgi:hypothetical protein
MQKMSSQPINIALLIPDGVGVRNFLLGKFLKKTAEDNRVDVFHVIPETGLEPIRKQFPANIQWHELRAYSQSKTALVLQTAVGYSQMYWADTMAMRRIRNAPIRGSFKARALYSVAKVIGRLAASPTRMRVLDRWHYAAAGKSPEVNYYRRAFLETRPSVVFCSHQRPSVVVPAILAARSLGIPTATFIFSWDNLTSKGRIIAPFDHFLVWSNHMRDELTRYYPDVPASRIHVVGTPQFEPYADPDLLWSREEFFQRIGADPKRPLICYSCGDPGTCPEDQEHIRVLMELVRSRQIQGAPQVIVRPVPVESGRRYEKVRAMFPEMIFAQPEWQHTMPGDWSRVIPTAEDIQFLANLTQHADLNVNLGSTMALDFGIHDKPVVNIAFDVADPPIFGMPVWDYYYFFEHYRPVIELAATRPARSAQQLADLVNAYLKDPGLDREGRRKLFEMQVGVPLSESSARIHDTLRDIAMADADTRGATAKVRKQRAPAFTKSLEKIPG